MTENNASLTIRKRSRLPEGRVVQVTVARLSVSRVALLVLILGGLAFLGGVVAGSGGYYRHAVENATSGLGDGNLLRVALLAPDRATTQSLAERLSAVEGNMQEISEGYALQTGSIDVVSGGLSHVSIRLGDMENGIRDMETSVRNATAASDRAEDALDGLLTAIRRARELAAEQAETQQEEMANDP